MRTILIVFALAVACTVLSTLWRERDGRGNGANMSGLRAYGPIPATQFLHDRQHGRLPDTSGCYVIITDPAFDQQGRVVAWNGVYVGQSVHLTRRVRDHLTGHGNGDVYADTRDGHAMWVILIPCDARMMNTMERRLIAAWHATDSYNRTRGGGRRR